MNRHRLRERDYLGHMLDAVRQIQKYAAGKTSQDFLLDRLLQDAVVRNIEILGEAARNLLNAVPEASSKYPGIPLAAIYAMRNQLSHGYFMIDSDVVWNVVVRDVPELRREIEAAIAALNASPPPEKPSIR